MREDWGEERRKINQELKEFEKEKMRLLGPKIEDEQKKGHKRWGFSILLPKKANEVLIVTRGQNDLEDVLEMSTKNFTRNR